MLSNVSLTGPGFAGATASVTGETVTLFNTQISESSSGTVTLQQLTTPSNEMVENLGSAVFLVQTAVSGEELAEIASSPEGRLIIPISMIRPVNGQGVSLALNRKVAVSGIATVDSGTFSSTRFTTYLQDESAGVAIDYDPINDIWTYATTGHRYTAIGTVTQVRGLTQISLTGNGGFIELGPDVTPEPKIRTVAQLLASAEEMEGTLIRIVLISKTDSSAPWPEPGLSETLTITDDGGGSLLGVFVNRFTDLSVYAEPEYPVDLVGIFSQFGNTSAPFNTGYQLLPRAYSDIHPPSEIESGFEWWREQVFTGPQLEDSFISGPAADPDGDGVPNLLEYALGGDPWENSRALLPEVLVADGFLEITFRRVKDAEDLIYKVKSSPDLLDWAEIWSSDDFPYTSTEAVMEETVTDMVALDGAGSRFLKLVVTRRDP